MSALSKILVGALATTALAWFLNGPMGFGERCAGTAASFPGAEVAAPEVPATPEAVKTCQTQVDDAIKGKTINFATDDSSVANDSVPLVDAVAGLLKACPGTVVEVAGHTDRQGEPAPNQALSQRRASAVASALTARGVPTGRLIAKGYGETKPIDTTGPEDNPVNRRIEFHVAAVSAGPAPAADR